jgi:hypothetical protein
MVDLIKKEKIKNKEQLEKRLAEIWDLPKASSKEKEMWSYKNDLYVSPKVLLKKDVIFNGEKYKISECYIDK